jgi:vesicle coat complex subunit
MSRIMDKQTIAMLKKLKRCFMRERSRLKIQSDAEDLARMYSEAASTERAARQWDAAIAMLEAEIRNAKEKP